RRAASSGIGSSTTYAKRRGDIKAGSTRSGRLVAPSTVTSLYSSRVSSSVRSWLTTRSTAPPAWSPPRTGAMASRSSRNSRQGDVEMARVDLRRLGHLFKIDRLQAGLVQKLTQGQHAGLLAEHFEVRTHEAVGDLSETVEIHVFGHREAATVDVQDLESADRA